VPNRSLNPIPGVGTEVSPGGSDSNTGGTSKGTTGKEVPPRNLHKACNEETDALKESLEKLKETIRVVKDEGATNLGGWLRDRNRLDSLKEKNEEYGKLIGNLQSQNIALEDKISQLEIDQAMNERKTKERMNVYEREVHNEHLKYQSCWEAWKKEKDAAASYNRKIGEIMDEKKNLEHKIQALRDTEETLKLTNQRVQGQLTSMKKQLNSAQEQIGVLQRNLAESVASEAAAEARFSLLEKETEELQEKYYKESLTVNGLRSVIAKAETKKGPLRAEEFYVRNFRELQGELEMWIAKTSKTKAKKVLLDHDVQGILQRLTRLGGYARIAAEFLHTTNAIQTWYAAPHWRIPLIRHIVAVYFFELIFRPFVFGLPRDASHVLNFVDNVITTEGGSSLNVLIFRGGERAGISPSSGESCWQIRITAYGVRSRSADRRPYRGTPCHFLSSSVSIRSHEGTFEICDEGGSAQSSNLRGAGRLSLLLGARW
jgi:predicted  nucleic acid-binding Zn-ribbon protein